jgi:hypothetical protein
MLLLPFFPLLGGFLLLHHRPLSMFYFFCFLLEALSRFTRSDLRSPVDRVTDLHSSHHLPFASKERKETISLPLHSL